MTVLGFTPHRHGFHFNNDFRSRGPINTTGLCGGMCVAAFNYFRYGIPIPYYTATDIPDFDVSYDFTLQTAPSTLPLSDYLFHSQLASFLNVGALAQFVAPFDTIYADEFERARRHIDAGEYALLGLKQRHAPGTINPPTGHQVLCYGYEMNGQQLFVYDPNFHDEEVVITAARDCNNNDVIVVTPEHSSPDCRYGALFEQQVLLCNVTSDRIAYDVWSDLQLNLSVRPPAIASPVTRVVYRGNDAHIHELSLVDGADWYRGDLTTATDGAPDAAGDPHGYATRADGTARTVYRGADNHIHELSLTPGGNWYHGDLTAASRAGDAAGDPHGYASESDRTARVVYRGADNHIHEVSLPLGGGWQSEDLSARAGAPDARGNPVGYSSCYSSVARVVYRGTDDHIHELNLSPQGEWTHGDLTLQGGTPAAGDPMAYVSMFDQTARVVYRGDDDHIHELSLPNGGAWSDGDLTPGGVAAAGDPFAYNAMSDYTCRVVYLGDDGHIHECSLHPGGSWRSADLTGSGSAPAVAGDVTGYSSLFDRAARVLYRSNDGRLEEISMPGGGAWSIGELPTREHQPAGRASGYSQ